MELALLFLFGDRTQCCSQDSAEVGLVILLRARGLDWRWRLNPPGSTACQESSLTPALELNILARKEWQCYLRTNLVQKGEFIP